MLFQELKASKQYEDVVRLNLQLNKEILEKVNQAQNLKEELKDKNAMLMPILL